MKIRQSILDQVALCAHVAAQDTAKLKLANGDGSQQELSHMSYRKKVWKEKKLALAQSSSSTPNENVDDALTTKTIVHEDNKTNGNSTDTKNPSLVKKKLTDRADVSENDIPFDYETFLDEITANKVKIHAPVALETKPADKLQSIYPCKRDGNSLTHCRVDGMDLLVVFGGRFVRDTTILHPNTAVVRNKNPYALDRIRTSYSNFVFTLNLETLTWALQRCSGTIPPERSDHTAVFVAPHYLYTYGGRGRNGQIYHDFYVLSLRDWQWTQVPPYGRMWPGTRYWHAMCALNDRRLFIFGGRNDAHIFDDLLQFDALEFLETISTTTKPQSPELPRYHEWRPPVTVGKAPSARFGMALIVLDHDRIGVLGGWKQHHKKKEAADRSMDFYVLDTVTWVWTQPRLPPHATFMSIPSARFLFEWLYVNQTIVVFGGFQYDSNGEATDTYASLTHDIGTLYTLDPVRMIWRQQRPDHQQVTDWHWSHMHSSSNHLALSSAYSCTAAAAHTRLVILYTAIDNMDTGESSCGGQSAATEAEVT